MSFWILLIRIVAVRAKNAKNRKLQPLPLHPEVVTALKRLEEERHPAPTDRVFFGIFPKRETFRRDLKRAGIKNSEDPSGKLHFHSLRHTLNHRLQENGVVPTVAQHLMRHSTITLTSRTYISSASLPLADAIKRMPSIVPGIKTDTPIDTLDTPIDTLKSDAAGHSVSQAGTKFSNCRHDPKPLINKGFMTRSDALLARKVARRKMVGATGFELEARASLSGAYSPETHKETHTAQRSLIPTCSGSFTHGAICRQTSRLRSWQSLAQILSHISEAIIWQKHVKSLKGRHAGNLPLFRNHCSDVLR